MRCSDVTRELAAPTGGLGSAEIDRHLAGCPRCADWARNAERLDRIWAATRPAEPTPAAFDALWSRVTEAAEAPERPSVLTLGRVRAWGLAVAGLAAAAALLLTLRPPAPNTPGPAPEPGPTLLTYDAVPGEVLVIHIEGDNRIEVVHQPLGAVPGADNYYEIVSAVDPAYELLVKAGGLE